VIWVIRALPLRGVKECLAFMVVRFWKLISKRCQIIEGDR
jgi:hypothetical protein